MRKIRTPRVLNLTSYSKRVRAGLILDWGRADPRLSDVWLFRNGCCDEELACDDTPLPNPLSAGP